MFNSIHSKAEFCTESSRFAQVSVTGKTLWKAEKLRFMSMHDIFSVDVDCVLRYRTLNPIEITE